MTVIFNCYLQKEDAVRELLKQFPDGTEHPLGPELLTRTGSKPLNPDPGYYLNQASLDSVTSQVERSFQEFQQHLDRYRAFVRQMLLPGQSGEFTANDLDVLLAWGAICRPTFFDGVAYTTDAVTSFNKKKTVSNLVHSGDHRANELFLHTVTVTGSSDIVRPRVLVVSACGYNKNQLHTFAPSNPHILMIDVSNEIVYIVPFTLERAAIGGSHLIAPLIIEQSDGGHIRWYVPNTPIHYTNINTGEYPDGLKHTIKRVAETFSADFQQCREQEIANASAQSSADSIASPSQAPTVPSSNLFLGTCMTLFVENGVSPPMIDARALSRQQIVLCRFGNTLDPSRLETQPRIQPPSMVNLPILSGMASGHRSLALGVQSPHHSVSYEEWMKHILCTPSLVYASPRWLESLMQANLHRLNGILVVTCELPSIVHTSLEELEKALNALCIPCTRLMGPCAVILIHDSCTGQHFYYRGPHALWPGLFEENLRFGDQVSDFSVERFEQFALDCQPQTAPTPFSFAVPEGDKKIVWEGRIVESVQEIVTALTAVSSVEALLTLRPMIQSAFAQISVGYSTTEVRDLQLQIREIVNKHILALLAPVHRRRKEIITLLTDETLKELSKELKDLRGTERAMTREVKFILDDLELLSSCQLTSTRNVSVQSSVRKAAIQQNLADASSMTPADFGEMVEEVCDWCIIGQANEDETLRLLNATSGKDLEPWLVGMGNDFIAYALGEHEWSEDLQLALQPLCTRECAQVKGPIELCPNCTTFDPSTMACLLEGTGAGEADNHLLATKGTPVAFRLQQRSSCLVVPCRNDAREWDGGNVDFMNRTNEPTIAKFRILFRAHLSNLRLRDCPIDVRSKELSLASVIMMMSLMESVRSRMDHVPTEADRNTTTCEMMRGLMDIAMTFASAGTTPASFVFQLTQSHANVALPSTPGEWTLYAWLPRLFKHTAMKQTTVTAQTRLLVVRALRKMIVDPLTEPLRKEVSAIKKTNAVDAQRARDTDLQWKAAAMELFRQFDPVSSLADGPISVESAAAIALRLLAHVPAAGKTNSTRLFVRTLKIISVQEELDADDWAYIRDYSAQVHNKRSGCFRETKRAALQSQDPKTVIETGVQNVASFLNIDPSKIFVQNRESFDVQEADVNEEARMRMKGDGEIARAPWCSRKALDIDEGLTREELLGGLLVDFTPSQANVVSLPKKEELVQLTTSASEAQKALAALNSTRKEPAVKLAETLSEITVAEVLTRSKLPVGPLISLLLSAGCTPENMRDTVAAILDSLLVNWQDVVESEQKAVALFASLVSASCQ
jgi:hypothetical protein